MPKKPFVPQSLRRTPRLDSDPVLHAQALATEIAALATQQQWGAILSRLYRLTMLCRQAAGTYQPRSRYKLVRPWQRLVRADGVLGYVAPDNRFSTGYPVYWDFAVHWDDALPQAWWSHGHTVASLDAQGVRLGEGLYCPPGDGGTQSS
jgi:hypothetical protein